MADKDKKPSLLETLAFLVVALIVVAALFALFTEFWKWATTNRRRAWICLPIMFWIPLFGLVGPTIVLFLAATGLADFSDENSLIHEQQLLVNWSAAIMAAVISLIITGRIVRKIPEEMIDLEPPATSTISEKKIPRIGTRGWFGVAMCGLGILRVVAANGLAREELERLVGTGILDIVTGLLFVVWGYRKYGRKQP